MATRLKLRAPFLFLLPLFVLLTAVTYTLQQEGYDDTPYLPEGKWGRWRVHDKARPRPRVVRPGEGTAPPSDAVVLFDGTDLDEWQKPNGEEAGWKLVDGAMEVTRTGSIRTKKEFGDVQLHLEWRTPSEIEGKSQGRGNSGVYLMGSYEIQVLDSYRNDTYPDGQAASLYGQYPPAVNACRGPGEWQTYDIFFDAPRFEEESGELLSPATVTVVHNGVLVQNGMEFLGRSTHRRLPEYVAHPPKGPIMLQDHGNPVRYRNIWIRELD